MKNVSDTVKVWKHEDDSTSVTYFILDAMKYQFVHPKDGKVYEGSLETLKKKFSKTVLDAGQLTPLESEDDYISRITTKLKAERDEINKATEFTKQASDIPTGDKDKRRMDDSGNVIIDDKVVTKNDKIQQVITSTRENLKTGQPLSDEQLDYLVGKPMTLDAQGVKNG